MKKEPYSSNAIVSEHINIGYNKKLYLCLMEKFINNIHL